MGLLKGVGGKFVPGTKANIGVVVVVVILVVGNDDDHDSVYDMVAV